MTNFTEKETKNWIIDFLLGHYDEKMLYCDSPAWFKGLVEDTTQHFKLSGGVRAFKHFTGVSGMVLGISYLHPVCIYYTAVGYHHFYGRKKLQIPHSWHVEFTATYTVDGEITDTCTIDEVTYTYTVTPYCIPLIDDLRLPAGAAGPELVKQLLGVSGLDRVARNQLMVESNRIRFSESSRNLSNLKLAALAAAKALKADRSWDNARALVDALLAWLPGPVTLGQCLTAKEPVFAAPVLCPGPAPRPGTRTFTTTILPHQPGTVIPLLAWLLTNHYCESWNDAEVGWARAAVALLPASLRPGSDSGADHAGSLTTIKAMLVACERGVTGTREERLQQATEHLTAALSPETGVSTPGAVDAALGFTEPNPPTPLPPSDAFFWVHLVYCVMQRTASFSDLTSHPLLASSKDRQEMLLDVSMCVADGPSRGRVIANTILKALWPSGKLAEPLTPKVDAFHKDVARTHLRIPHSVPFLLAREYTSKALYNTDERGKELTMELYGDDMEATPAKLLAYLGRHFPALELAAWLMQAGGLCGAPDTRLGCTAQATLAGLGCTDQALAAALETYQHMQRERAHVAEEEASLVAQIPYDVREIDLIVKHLIRLPREAEKHFAVILMNNAEPWKALSITSPTNEPHHIVEKFRRNMQSLITDELASLGLTQNDCIDELGQYITLIDSWNTLCSEVNDFSITAQYELLRLALALSTLSREGRFRVVKQWVEVVKPAMLELLIKDARKEESMQAHSYKTQLAAMQYLGACVIAKVESSQADPSDTLKTALVVAGPPAALALARMAARLLDYEQEIDLEIHALDRIAAAPQRAVAGAARALPPRTLPPLNDEDKALLSHIKIQLKVPTKFFRTNLTRQDTVLACLLRLHTLN